MRQIGFGTLGVLAVFILAGVTTLPADAAGVTSPVAFQLRTEAPEATSVAWHPIRRVKSWWHGRRSAHTRRTNRR
jgi:hypothetical protein